jgi:hypothetical protein
MRTTRADGQRLTHILKSIQKNPKTMQWMREMDASHKSFWLHCIVASTDLELAMDPPSFDCSIPCPMEMQKSWNVLRDEAADNYGFREGYQEDEARERMGPLTETTLALVRNIGAAERKKATRVEAFVTERNEGTSAATREERARHEEGDEQQQLEEVDDLPEDMDALMDAVAKAISQTERERTPVHAGAT